MFKFNITISWRAGIRKFFPEDPIPAMHYQPVTAVASRMIPGIFLSLLAGRAISSCEAMREGGGGFQGGYRNMNNANGREMEKGAAYIGFHKVVLQPFLTRIVR